MLSRVASLRIAIGWSQSASYGLPVTCARNVSKIGVHRLRRPWPTALRHSALSDQPISVRPSHAAWSRGLRTATLSRARVHRLNGRAMFSGRWWLSESQTRLFVPPPRCVRVGDAALVTLMRRFIGSNRPLVQFAAEQVLMLRLEVPWTPWNRDPSHRPLVPLAFLLGSSGPIYPHFFSKASINRR